MSGLAHSFTVAGRVRENADSVLLRGYRNADMRPVFLKCPRGGRPTTNQLARLRHEYSILSALNGPGVAKAFGIEDLGDTVALVLDFPGESSIDCMVGPKPLDISEFLRTAIAMADAIESVHRHQIIHKDIKPENFFRREGSDDLTLIEFGAATRLMLDFRRSMQVGRLDGTLAYMSPEQTGRMNRSVDRRTDLYSFGVALYELATGALPFPTTDPLELVHSHIARSPVPLHETRTEWPRVLSDIVMRLLAKNAEDRYQDISGLKADLVRCKESLARTGAVAVFTLGEKDFSDELRIPQKLYGRERELEILTSTFARACDGGAELLLISGHSGVGKSVLVGELQRQRVSGSQFAMGKFDPIGRRIPHAPIIQGCGEMLRAILSEPPATFARWRERILHAVGNNGRVVTDILPELSLVIGNQAPVEDLDPAQSQHRFEATFLAFLQVFASAGRPLVFFLDDLQWADAASLRMVRLLLTAPKAGHLLVIGAYRDTEIAPTHPLTAVLADLRRLGASIAEIKIEPLRENAILRLLGDTFASNAESVAALAKLALQKTEGNPFFLAQFLTTLYRDGLVRFNPGLRQWTFQLRAIGDAMVTDNVVDFMVARLQRLPPETQDLLRTAACIGHRFDRRTLVQVAERRAAEVSRLLWPALREGLVVPVDGGQAFVHEATLGGMGVPDRDEAENPSYRFLHDRVHQAAYERLAADQRQAIHLRIGRMQLSGKDMPRDDGQLFEIVNHLNLGTALIEDATERKALAKLNCAAARKAKDAAAHATATNHLDTAWELLGEAAWQDDYETAFQAQICRAECDIATGHFEHAFLVLDLIDGAARNDIDRATALALRTLILVSSNRMVDAIACGVRAAGILGMDLPLTPEAVGPATGAAFGALFAAMGPRGFEALLDLPAMTDRKSLLLLHVLHRIMPAAAQVDPALMTLIVARAVHLSLERGSSPVLAYYCACLAHVHVAMGDIPKADALGKIADRLNRNAASPAIACAVHFVLGAFVTFWSAGSEGTLAHLRAGLGAALEAGDYLYACYCAMAEAVYTFQLGKPLEDVAQTARDAADLIDRTGDVTNHDVVQSLRLAIDRLVASSATPTSPAEEESERRVLESRNPFVTSCHFLFQAVEKYLAGDDEGASVCILRSKPSVPGNFNGPQSMFFEALLLAHRIQSGADHGPKAIAQLAAAEEQLRGWASAAVEPFGHRHALVAAELAAARGDDAGALTMFEQATRLAHEAGAPLLEGMANEQAGRYAERRGWGQMARELYFRNASLAFGRWGHVRKARQLAARVAGSPARAPAFGVDSAAWAAGVRTDNVDAIALAKATQALSGEIVLSKLMARLMDIAIAQAGAERGYLLLHRNGEMWLECSAGVANELAVGRLQSGMPLSELSALLPHTIVDFVMQARATVVLTPTEPNRFSADPYLARQRPQSLLCMPMIRQGELIGILYLENRLTSDVFGADQVELLEMLSTQAAISIENARLYEEMEERVHDRTRKLEESLRTIQEDQAKIIAAERRAAVAPLESEMAIAQRIQTSILPRDLSMPGMEIAAVMETATEVGGDYYDMVPTDDGGCWLGIGDVSGHGLNAGLVMLMVQSGLASLMTSDSWVDPGRLLCMVNRAIYENVRCRLKRDDYVTLSLFRFFADGRFLVAGAHEEIVVWRARTGRCELIETRGTWIGMLEHIERSTSSREGQLADGDVMVLFTDGIVEARGPNEEQFGLKRLVDLTAVAHAEPVGEICRRILGAVKAWSPERQDDQTIVALRRGTRR